MKLLPLSLAAGVLLASGLFTSTWARAAAAGTCGTEELAAGSQSIDVTSGGLKRAVLLYVPQAVAGHRALPLVIDLHGSGGNGAQQAQLSRLPALAARNGFVVAEPSGGVVLPGAPDAHYWNIPGVPLIGGTATPADAPDDVLFISDVIDAIAAKTCIDPRRIFVTGMSGGARMASLLACRLSTRIAAVAPVSGLRAGLPASDSRSCQPRRPVPIVTFHGTGDRVNPVNGDGSPRWSYSIPVALARWAELDHCQGAPHEERISAHVTLVRYRPCAQGAEILFYRTDASGEQGGGHAWPGSVPRRAAAGKAAEQFLRANEPSTEIDASALMWTFFEAHPLPAGTQ